MLEVSVLAIALRMACRDPFSLLSPFCDEDDSDEGQEGDWTSSSLEQVTSSRRDIEMTLFAQLSLVAPLESQT